MPTTRSKRRSQILAKISLEETIIDENHSPIRQTRPKNNRKSTARKSLGLSDLKLTNAELDPTEKIIEDLTKIRISLQTSTIPEYLTCRDEQFDQIYNFCYDGISERSSGVLYVAGVPGTGKTATMRKVLEKLSLMSDNNEIEDFEVVHVNGMTLATPKNIFIAIYKQISGQDKDQPTPTCNDCKRKVSNYFTTKNSDSPVTLLFVDELDLLQTKNQDVLYQIFDWPQKSNSRLLIVSIANTLDLPERLESSRVASRIGHSRILFKPYSKKQLFKVIQSRLDNLAKIHEDDIFVNLFQDDAIEFVARKVTSVTGDARRALDACRLAVDIFIDEIEAAQGVEDKENLNRDVRKSPRKIAKVQQAPPNLPEKIGVQHALKALNQLFGGGNQNSKPANKLIKSLPKLDQIVLKSIVSTLKNTGSDTVAVGEIWRISLSQFVVEDLVGSDGSRLSKKVVNEALQKLAACSIIDVDSFRLGPLAKVRVVLRCDDVLFALQE